MSQEKQRRIATDAIEYDTYQVLIKGPMAKDGYILFGTFRTYDEAKLMYDWFPNIPAATIKITNSLGSLVKGHRKTFQFKQSNFERYSALDLVEQTNDLWDIVIAGRLRMALAQQPKPHKAPLPAWGTDKPIIKGDLVKIANQATKRNQFLAFVKRMADAVKPDLKLIKGGVK